MECSEKSSTTFNDITSAARACLSRPLAFVRFLLLMEIVPGARKSVGISIEDLYFPSSSGMRRSAGFVSVDQNKALPEPPLRSKFGFKYLPPWKTTNSISMLADCVVKRFSTGQPWKSTIRTASNFTTSSPGAVLKSAHSVEEVDCLPDGSLLDGSLLDGSGSEGCAGAYLRPPVLLTLRKRSARR